MKICSDTHSPCGWGFSNQRDVSPWPTTGTLTVRSRLGKTFRWLDLNASAHTKSHTLTSRNDEYPHWPKERFTKQLMRIPSHLYWLSFLNMFRVKITALFFFHWLTFEYQSIIILQNVRSHLPNDILSHSRQRESSNWITFGIGSFLPENVNVISVSPCNFQCRCINLRLQS